MNATENEPLHKISGANKIVICPDCGQMEWWTEEELDTHGICRTLHKPGDVCPECGEELR